MNLDEEGVPQHHRVDDNVERALEIGSLVKMFGGWLLGAVAITFSVIMWIQGQSNSVSVVADGKYYPKLAGDNLKEEISKVEQRLDSLEQGNLKIIEMLGRLEGSRKGDR